ncbi:MAG TPA: hypothetical protein VFQ53_12625 [Kofleriaceae bacterium]|nr:hypothetical protein [Kofleriaceae bacterium]
MTKPCRVEVPTSIDELAERVERAGSESDVPLLELVEQTVDHETRSQITASLARCWDFALAKR